MAELKNTIVNGVLNVNGDVIASKIIKRGGTSSQILMADGSVVDKSSIQGTTYTGGTGISIGTDNVINHANSITAVTTAGLYKIKYDAQGHITGTESFTLPTVPDVSGFVTGPGESTDKAIARFNSTSGKVIQNSNATIDDNGIVKASGFGDGTITIKPQSSNEVNFGGTSTDTTIYFGHKATDSRPKPTIYIFGGTAADASVKANKFIKTSSSDSYVLLGGGGHKAVSDFSTSDTKVTQSETTTANWRKVVLSYQNDSTTGIAITSHTNQVYVTPNIEVQPSTGNIRIAGSIYEGGTALSSKYAAKDHNHDETYLKAEVDTLQSVTNRGATTTKTITALSYSVNSAVDMEYDSTYKALKFVFE